MKIVVNKCYGGFDLSDKALEALGVDWADEVSRTDARLVEMVEKDADMVRARYTELAVVELPDEVTDYHINEYDGFESIVYVVDGKLHWMY